MNISEHDKALIAMRNFALFREKRSNVALLWKNRAQFTRWWNNLLEAAQQRTITRFPREYEDFVTEKLGITTRCLWRSFRPVGNNAVPLTDENGENDLGDILGSSALLQSLNTVWAAEPQCYIAFFGSVPTGTDSLSTSWVQATAAWICDRYS